GVERGVAGVLEEGGKPSSVAADGSCGGHAAAGAALTRRALTRLRFSNSEVESVARLVMLHLRPVFYTSDWTDGAVRRLARDAGDQLWTLMKLARADIAASRDPHRAQVSRLGDR